jgi:hypothetical protein
MHSRTLLRAACSSPNTPPRLHDRLPAPKGSSPVSACRRGSPLHASSLGAPSVSLDDHPYLSIQPPIAYVVVIHLRSVRARAPGSYPCASLASRCRASPWKGSLTPRVTTVDDSPERAPPSPVTVARRRRCSPRLTSLLSRHADARCATFHHLERPWCCRVRIVNRASSAADPEGPPPDVCTPCVAEMPDPLAHRPGRAASSSCLSTHPRASCLSRSRPAGRSRESPLADLMRRQAVAERSVWTHQDEHLVHRASSSFFPRWSRLR